jgi:hypothetical protein
VTDSTYRQAKLTKAVALAELGIGIARHLGEGWYSQGEEDWGARLRGPGGMHLLVQPAGYTEVLQRVTVSGIRPPDSPYLRASDTRGRQIGVAVARGPATIAAEITRRLLPGYGELLAEAYAYIERQASDQAQQDAVVDDLIGVLPGSTRSTTSARGSSQVQVHLDRPTRDGRTTSAGTATVWSAGREVQLELRGLPPGLAVKVLAVLAAERPAVAVAA